MYLVEFWVNDQELTPIAQSVYGNHTANIVHYVVSFTEPSTTAVMAIKAYEDSDIYTAGFKMICNCTRFNSPWNLVSSIGSGWLSVSSTRTPDYQSPTMRPDWNLLNYFNASSTAIAYAGIQGLFFSNATSSCGDFTKTTFSLGHPQGLQNPRSWYWGLRRMVNQTLACGTNPPVFAPTSLPSLAPTNPPV